MLASSGLRDRRAGAPHLNTAARWLFNLTNQQQQQAQQQQQQAACALAQTGMLFYMAKRPPVIRGRDRTCRRRVSLLSR